MPSEQARRGSEVHVNAVRRLKEARAYQRRMGDAFEVSKDTAGEPTAAMSFSAAREQTAAREAWLSWIERGY